MTSSADTTSLQDARALASKLYGQCRDSASSYKLLTTSVRKLRNALEEAEEVFDETRTLGPDDLRLLDKVIKSGEILCQLDLALQSFRSSRNTDVNESAIADFKTVLDVTEHEVSRAFEAITTGEIELRLDTNIIHDAFGVPKSSTGDQSSSSRTADSAHDRKSSCASSAWSLVHRDSPSQESTSDASSAHPESRTAYSPRQDKEVYDFGGPYLYITPSSSVVPASRPSLDWRTPFASPDPLSISIEQASSMILAPDEDFVSSATRPRSAPNSTVFVEPQIIKHASEIENQAAERAAFSARNQVTERIDPGIEGHGDKAHKVSGKVTTTASQGESSSLLTQGETGTIGESSFPIAPRRPSEPGSGISHLSPKSAAEGFARQDRNDSDTPITGSSAASEDTAEPNEVALHETQTSIYEAKTLDPSIEDAEQHQIRANQDDELLEDSSAVTSTVFESRKTEASTQPLRRQLSDPQGNQLEIDHIPSMPSRRPPPPPPKPRRIGTRRRASTYRIVNATASDSASSEDELYSTSKPTSPTTTSRSTTLETATAEIPRVSIDETACEEGPERGETRLCQDDAQTHPESVDVVTEVDKDNPEPTLAPNDNRSNLDRGMSHQESSPPLPRRPSAMISPRDDRSEKVLASKTTPPPVPRRPVRNRHQSNDLGQNIRPLPATIKTSPAAIPQDSTTAMAEKELVPDPGPEVHNNLEIQTRTSVIIQRISVDAALNVRSPSISTQSTATIRDNVRHSRAASTSQVESTRPMDPDSTLTGFYGPGFDSTHPTELERERINHIVHFWNNSEWDQAEAYLMDYLHTLVEYGALARARRVRHLIGVCLSFQGEWSRAIPFFLSVLRTPIHNISEIDDGDCAAAYWLGDTYSLLNKRTEALLAYCIAERSSLFNDPAAPSLSECICAEQEAVQLGVSKDVFKARWAQEAFNNTSSNGKSLLDPNVITPAVAKTLFESEPRKSRRANASTGSDSTCKLDQNRPRSNALLCWDKLPRVGKFHQMKIYVQHFHPDTEWPMMYDPLFAIANVQRGRLLAYECDLLAVFTSNKEARIPKSGPMGLSRMDCFTCTDLSWLIRTIRECLRMLEMDFSEVANVEGTWFVVRYSFLQPKVATTNYFSVALFRQTFRGGYGAEICPDGICSARIIRYGYDHDKGVHNSETKRIRKLIRDYLDEAARQGPKAKRKGSTSGSAPLGAANAADEPIPPPIPPRPPKYG